MKRIVFTLFLLFSFAMIYAAEPDSTTIATNRVTEPVDKENCSCKGIPLHGKVKVVTAFADFKVKIVESFPDLDVQVVSSFPDKCGQWQFVESFPDFTIQFVDAFPDFKIKYVNAFPGVH